MRSLTVDGAVLAVLSQADGLTEIRDAAGRVVGFLAPVSVERAHLYAEAAARIDPTAIRRRKEAGGQTYTTREVLARLQSLDPDNRQ
jgi:hypothetical protein